MNITETSRKDEVITSSCELVDQQDEVIKNLKEQQQALIYLLGGLTIISLIFWNCFCQKRITESGIGLLIGMIKKGPELVPWKSTVNQIQSSYCFALAYLLVAQWRWGK